MLNIYSDSNKLKALNSLENVGDKVLVKINYLVKY
jgi:hypothetical protein